MSITQSAIITQLSDLCRLLELDLTQVELRVEKNFPFRVSESFVKRMKKGDPLDPLLLQILPLKAEDKKVPGFVSDPLEEGRSQPVPGLLHKYQGRVLLTLTGACPIHCRYCFRRSFPYEELPGINNWQAYIDYISSDNSISEVILSGGDPLMIKDKHLNSFIKALGNIKHLKRLRVHSRMPIVTPDRVNSEMIEWLTLTHLKPMMIVHANHPNEINDEVETAIDQMRSAKIPVLNHTVLLKNINDRAATLIALSEKLFAAGIIPYYLNLLDKVSGTAHFEVEEQLAKDLIQEMRSQLPGYLVPKLVREVPDTSNKQVII